MKTIGYVAIAIVAMITMTICAFTCNFVGDGVQTVHNEYDPSAMLKKYEWFKNQSQFILKADQDIKNLKSEQQIKEQFENDNGKSHTSWDPITKNSYQEQINLNQQQRMAIVANRNKMVADYNAQSSKFNWGAFKTKDDLPPVSFDEIK